MVRILKGEGHEEISDPFTHSRDVALRWERNPFGSRKNRQRKSSIGDRKSSMGAYRAIKHGLSHPQFFERSPRWGGLSSMAYLLRFMEVDVLGNYDNPDAYPSRKTLLRMLQDLTISFGNPVYYNPDSTYFPPGITGANTRVPTTLLDFKDGKYNPDGSLPVITYEIPGPVSGSKSCWLSTITRIRKGMKGNPS